LRYSSFGNMNGTLYQTLTRKLFGLVCSERAYICWN